MKTLYIVRHAKSSWSHADLTDFERPLNARGHADAPRMGSTLNNLGAKPTIIRTSAANRAVTTARLLAGALQFPVEAIDVDASMYGAGPVEIIALIRELPDTATEVMFVGHNPTMHILAHRLAGFQGDNIPTCGVVCVDFDVEHWKDAAAEQGVLRYFEYPKKNH